jgi:spore germination protein
MIHNSFARIGFQLVIIILLSLMVSSLLRIHHNSSPPIVLVSIPYWDQERAVESFKNNLDVIDAIVLYWYHLTPEGTIEKYMQADEDSSIIEFAHQNNKKVLALIANLPDDSDPGPWDPERVRNIISDQESIEKHTNDILELLDQMNFDGVNIDYEALPGDLRSNFTQFIKHLHAELSTRNKLLVVAIHPKTSEGNPREDNGSHAQDWVALWPHLDYMYFMTYSLHHKESAPGPNATINWMRDVIRYARKLSVPSEKILLGIPFYGHHWVVENNNTFTGIDDDLTYEKAVQFQQAHDSRIKRNRDDVPHFVYHDGENEHILWFEDSLSTARKLKVWKEFDTGIAIWRLGGEDQRTWHYLREQK